MDLDTYRNKTVLVSTSALLLFAVTFGGILSAYLAWVSYAVLEVVCLACSASYVAHTYPPAFRRPTHGRAPKRCTAESSAWQLEPGSAQTTRLRSLVEVRGRVRLRV